VTKSKDSISANPSLPEMLSQFFEIRRKGKSSLDEPSPYPLPQAGEEIKRKTLPHLRERESRKLLFHLWERE
jgi:hypothetical protein